jgi:putative sigma-54 modulation protein
LEGAFGYMKTTITTKNFELTKSIETFVKEKFERLAKKVDKDTIIQITLSTGKEGQKAEALLYVAGHPLKMESVHENLYVSIDNLIDKVNYQVNKLTDKSHERKYESIRYLKENVEGDDEETMEQKQPIVKRKQFDMKPMMEEEALLQMEMLGHSFFFFFNGETDTMCLLYKRKDGNYGLIESVR